MGTIRDILSRYNPVRKYMVEHQHQAELNPVVENLASEIYNPGPEEITFTSFHPQWQRMWFFNKPPIYWKVLRCPPGEWVFLPHGQYKATVPSGSQEIKAVVNVGDSMFIGNKLPSRPEMKKMQVFQK